MRIRVIHLFVWICVLSLAQSLVFASFLSIDARRLNYNLFNKIAFICTI
jgi:hypothetical protein